jgi:Domain of Unknown Function (DUF1080)
MVRATLLVVTVCLGTVVMAQNGGVNTLTPKEKAAGWRLLFDGKSLEGWRGYNKQTAPEAWKVVDGALTLTGKGGDLLTTEQFGDFELSLEWKLGKVGANSGVFFRAVETSDPIYYSAPEIQIIDNKGHKDAVTHTHTAGSNYDMDAPSRDVTKPVGEWNELRVIVKGPHVEHWMNGVKIVEYELWSPEWEAKLQKSKFAKWTAYGRAKKGHVALQDHGDPMAFRNIKIRPLTSSPS